MIIHVTNFKVKCISEINNIVFLYIQLFSRTDAHNFVRTCMFICIYMLVDISCNGKWWSFHFKYYLCSEKQTVCGGFVCLFFFTFAPFYFLVHVLVLFNILNRINREIYVLTDQGTSINCETSTYHGLIIDNTLVK